MEKYGQAISGLDKGAHFGGDVIPSIQSLKRYYAFSCKEKEAE
jgi:hypothetical protein